MQKRSNWFSKEIKIDGVCFNVWHEIVVDTEPRTKVASLSLLPYALYIPFCFELWWSEPCTYLVATYGNTFCTCWKLKVFVISLKRNTIVLWNSILAHITKHFNVQCGHLLITLNVSRPSNDHSINWILIRSNHFELHQFLL